MNTGCLRNLTDGGENPPNHKGRKRTKETLEKMFKARREFRFTQEAKSKMSKTRKGKSWNSARHEAVAKLSKESRLRMSEAHKNQKAWWLDHGDTSFLYGWNVVQHA